MNILLKLRNLPLRRFPSSLPTRLSSIRTSFILIILFSIPNSLFADKLDSLLHIHDTATIVYFFNRADSLALGKIYTVQGSRITGFHRYNPIDQQGRFSAGSSNVGLPYRNLLFDVERSGSFYTGMRSFDAYTYDPENTRYYRHLIPVTYLSYANGPDKEQLFRVVHSHTIKRLVTIGVDFNLINSPGDYNNQKSDDKSVVFTGQYFTKNLRFGSLASYRHNKFIVRENGGIVSDSIFEAGVESDSRLFDVNLTTAQNLVKSSGVTANAYFFLSGEPVVKDSTKTRPPAFHAGRADYHFNYHRQIQVYSDQNPPAPFYSTFGPVLDSNMTYDSLIIETFDNRFSWSNLRMGDLMEKKYLTVVFAATHSNTTVRDSISRRSFNSLVPEASLIIRPYPSLMIQATGKMSFGTFNNAGYELNGTAMQSFKTPKDLTGDLRFGFISASQQAGSFYTHFNSNYFRWDTSFSNQIIQKAFFIFRFNTLHARAEYLFISDYVYLDQTAHPRQYKGSINLIRAELTEEFRYKVWGFDAQLVYTINSNKEIIRVPDFMARVSVYPTLSLFRNAAVFQPGIDLFYNSAYYASAYMPALRMFYLQDEKKIGNYLYMDLFASLMVKRFRIFVKYQHLNALWSKNKYYMIPHYPNEANAFKFGVSWSFYD